MTGIVPSPRVWARTNNGIAPYEWVAVVPDANGTKSYLYITWLIQVLLLNLGESPIFSDFGIPGQQSVVTQIVPDYYVALTQQRFAPYFASLQISRVPDPPSGKLVYNVTLTTIEGTVYSENIYR